ncbi:hypothetical protein HLB44_32280 [Aquincola sp. S2]|uniref:Lipoprotein n=1 Tax=Pseudaquabacterium terrae TaxID=2732868 RepID=A0ABX2ESS1_9BURK|nr:hypothetical protein [Aquabacterium terrae]NRF71676.1 hypothetical protein [Aquabacterium terrae]
MRQELRPGRMTLVSIACGVLLAACGGGGGGSSGGEGRLQLITFDYPGGGTLLSPPQKLKATTTSGLPVSYQSTTPTICTVTGDQMTLLTTGECRIVASQEGGTSADGVKWAKAEDVSQLFNVLKRSQTIAIDAPDYVLSSQTSDITLKAKASSGLPVTLSGGTPGVCTLEGDKLRVLGKGSCAVIATQAGDANHNEGRAAGFIAVDPLIVADGILGAGQGSSSSLTTKQGGAVSANPWSSIVGGGWEWCGNSDDTCFRAVSADQRVFTSALHIPKSKWTPGGWHASSNTIDIFAPGLSGFDSAGDTTGGLQVTTETALAINLGVNEGLLKAKKPVVVQLDLGKRNNGCNVSVSTLLWPIAQVGSYGLPLGNFAVTEACGIAGVSTASLDNDVRTLPNPWGTGPSDIVAALAAYQAALDKFKPARDSAVQLIKSSNVVRVRLRLMDINSDTSAASDGDFYASDLSVIGAITIQ